LLADSLEKGGHAKKGWYYYKIPKNQGAQPMASQRLEIWGGEALPVCAGEGGFNGIGCNALWA